MSWTVGGTTLGDPKAGYEAWIDKAQAIGYTAAGSVRVYNKDVTRYRLRVTWEDLSDSEKASLVTLYNTTADGAVSTFTLTDEDSTNYTARFLEPELRFVKSVNNRWDLTILLETSALVTT